MFLEKAEGHFDFSLLVNAVERVTEISQVLYEQTGLMHKSVTFSHKGVTRQDIEFGYFKCSVPSLIAHMSRHGDANATQSLSPYIGQMVSVVSQLP